MSNTESYKQLASTSEGVRVHLPKPSQITSLFLIPFFLNRYLSDGNRSHSAALNFRLHTVKKTNQPTPTKTKNQPKPQIHTSCKNGMHCCFRTKPQISTSIKLLPEDLSAALSPNTPPCPKPPGAGRGWGAKGCHIRGGPTAGTFGAALRVLAPRENVPKRVKWKIKLKKKPHKTTNLLRDRGDPRSAPAAPHPLRRSPGSGPGTKPRLQTWDRHRPERPSGRGSRRAAPPRPAPLSHGGWFRFWGGGEEVPGPPTFVQKARGDAGGVAVPDPASRRRESPCHPSLSLFSA